MTALFTRRTLLAALISTSSLIGLLPAQALAYDKGATSALNVDAHGVALRGHDVVAYFTAAAPTLGSAAFSASHDGAIYYFASAGNRDAFKANPVQYAPQFGGFCAMGVALDQKLDGDPSVWRVVNGNLYLNVNKEIQKKWLEDVPGHVLKATQAWPRIKNIAPKDL